MSLRLGCRAEGQAVAKAGGELLLALTAFAGAMAYGWWHRSTHATLEVQLVFNARGGAAIGADGGLVESIVARSGSITTSGCPPVKFPFLKALPLSNRPNPL